MRTAGTRNISVMPLGLRSSSSRSDGSTSRRMTERPPRDMAHSAQPDPPMWNSGMATRLTVSSEMLKVSPASAIAVDEVGVGQHDPLGQPGGARGVELHADLVERSHMTRDPRSGTRRSTRSKGTARGSAHVVGRRRRGPRCVAPRGSPLAISARAGR